MHIMTATVAPRYIDIKSKNQTICLLYHMMKISYKLSVQNKRANLK